MKSKLKYGFIYLFLCGLSFANEKIEVKKNVFNKIDIVSEKSNLSFFDKVKKKYIGEDINELSIQNLISDLSSELVNNGYQTSKIIFKDGNIKTGELSFEIIFGKINNIYIADEDATRKINFAFGDYQNKILKISDIDNGIDNLNVGGNSHLIQIIPSEKDFHSDILIRRKKEKPLGNLSLSIEGDENSDTNKKYDFNVDYSKSNILGINDNLELSLKKNLELKDKNRDTFKSEINFSFPYNKVKIKYTNKFERNKTKIKGLVQEIKSNTYKYNNELTVSTILKKFKKSKIELIGKVGVETKKSYIQGQKIKIQSYDKNIFDIGLTYENEINNGSYSFSTNYIKSIKKNRYELTEKKLKLNARYNKRIDDIHYSLNMGVDRSNIPFYLGKGEYVKGHLGFASYKKWEAYMQNTLRFNNIIPNVVPFVGFDIGTNSKKTIGGINAGFNISKNGVSASFTYKRGIGGIREENKNHFNFIIKYVI